jgi:hypothetical protein
MRTDENISKAMAEASSLYFSVILCILMKGGNMAPAMRRMKGSEAEATTVSSGLLTKAITYAPITNARDWKSPAKCCDMASWTVLDEVVIRVETLPGLIVSITLIGCANKARRYARRNAAEIRRPLIRIASYTRVSSSIAYL